MGFCAPCGAPSPRCTNAREASWPAPSRPISSRTRRRWIALVTCQRKKSTLNPAKRLRRPQLCAIPPTHRATPHQTGSARRPHQCPASQTCPRICTGTRGNTTAQAAGSTNKQPRNSQIGERKRSPKPDQCLRGVPLREQIYWLGIRVPLKLHYHGLQPLRNTTRIREFLRDRPPMSPNDEKRRHCWEGSHLNFELTAPHALAQLRVFQPERRDRPCLIRRRRFPGVT